MEKVRLRGINIAIADGETVRGDSGADIVLQPSFYLPTVDIDDEIAGRSDRIAEIVSESGKQSGIVFWGVKTRLRGLQRMSVAVCARGRLYAIADRTLNLRGDGSDSGSEINVLKTRCGRIGLLVDTDVIAYGLWQKAAAQSDFIVGVCDELTDEEKQVATLNSMAAGVPYVIACANGFLWGAEG